MKPPILTLGRWVVVPAVVFLMHGQALGDARPRDPASPVVVLKTTKALYRAAEPIVVVITNESPSPVTLLGGGFFCTVVRLEQRTSQGWSPIENCLRVSISIPEVLPPGLTRTLTFPLSSEPGLAGGFPRGTFRFHVIVEVDPQAGGQEFVAYSDPFTVR